MHARSKLARGAIAAGLALVAVACQREPVGGRCQLGVTPANVDQRIEAAPALDCDSRVCLHLPVATTLPTDESAFDLCTAACERDADCEGEVGSPCRTGFACAVPMVVGSFCCRRQCVCRDYFVIPPGGAPTPAACDPSDPRNTCCNLPGREGAPGCGA